MSLHAPSNNLPPPPQLPTNTPIIPRHEFEDYHTQSPPDAASNSTETTPSSTYAPYQGTKCPKDVSILIGVIVGGVAMIVIVAIVLCCINTWEAKRRWKRATRRSSMDVHVPDNRGDEYDEHDEHEDEERVVGLPSYEEATKEMRGGGEGGGWLPAYRERDDREHWFGSGAGFLPVGMVSSILYLSVCSRFTDLRSRLPSELSHAIRRPPLISPLLLFAYLKVAPSSLDQQWAYGQHTVYQPTTPAVSLRYSYSSSCLSWRLLCRMKRDWNGNGSSITTRIRRWS